MYFILFILNFNIGISFILIRSKTSIYGRTYVRGNLIALRKIKPASLENATTEKN